MQALFAWDLAQVPLEELLSFCWIEPEKIEKASEDELLFPRLLISGTIENIEEVDKIIIENLHNWDFSRLNLVDKAILRLSVYSLLFQKDIPSTIIIDEAINIAKDYGTDDSFKFVNGILDSIKNKG